MFGFWFFIGFLFAVVFSFVYTFIECKKNGISFRERLGFKKKVKKGNCQRFKRK